MDLDVWREPRTVVGNRATKVTLFLKGDDQEAWKDAYGRVVAWLLATSSIGGNRVRL
jgi:hypothetical protein